VKGSKRAGHAERLAPTVMRSAPVTLAQAPSRMRRAVAVDEVLTCLGETATRAAPVKRFVPYWLNRSALRYVGLVP
jgi:hypothetical protein